MDFKTHLLSFLSPEQTEQLLHSIGRDPVYGVRFNTQKITPSQLEGNFKTLTPHPLVAHGYYYDRQSERLAAHPWHQGGAFYLQEPSAMLVAELMPLKDSPMVVIDLAAAPGGKSIHLASRLPHGSVLLSHEIEYSRAKILSDNVTRWGLANTFVTSGDPHAFSTTLKGSVDAILLDAPCSGEGMFRKNEFAATDWSLGKVQSCAIIQQDLINLAIELLKPNGYLLYSTCTFNPLENEQNIVKAIHSGAVKLVQVMDAPALDRGINMPEAIRLFPHHFEGEGHFIALLQKVIGSESKPPRFNVNQISKKQLKLIAEVMNIRNEGMIFHQHLTQVYLLPEGSPLLPKPIGILQSGLLLGEFKGDDFIPDHASALAYPSIIDAPVLNLPMGDARLETYLRGESFTDSNHSGWVIVTCENVPLGWAKVLKGNVKNKLPKYLRKTK